MTHSDWVTLFAPAVSIVALAGASFVGAVLTGLTTKARMWLTAHGDAQGASAVASANGVIQQALMTGASTIAGKISRGELDYTNRAALEAEATREVGLVQQRVPDMLRIAAPEGATLVASLLAKVDAQIVASPTLPPTKAVPDPKT